jgi:mitochondrial fission protein ELM1
MKAPAPRIWVLLGPHRGDNNQVIALADALGTPYEYKQLEYNILRRLGPRLLGSSLVSLRQSSRALLKEPWPDLVIGIGQRSVPVARWIRRQNNGKTRLVRIGYPKVDTRLFDLIITSPQYPVPPADNVVTLPVVMSPYQAQSKARAASDWLDRRPRPHLLLAIGGRTKFWRLIPEDVARAAQRIADRARRLGGTLITVTSPRTEPEVAATVRSALEGKPNVELVDDRGVPFGALLSDADQLFVTADSVSMLSEAIQTGKPVGVVPIDLSPFGRRQLGAQPRRNGKRRDLRRLWSKLEAEGLVGTVDQPRLGKVDNPIRIAEAAVRRQLSDLFE